MELIRFDEGSGWPIEKYDSTFTMAPITPPDTPVKAACFHVPPGGVVGFHPAAVPQLFCVLAGSGWVTGADRERVPIRAFEGAFWEQGESHESGSDEGMTAVVLEGDVRPYRPTA
jgi:hypothetical protein